MSPVSRGRKTRNRRGGNARRGGPPSLAGLHAQMVRSFRELAPTEKPLDVEIFASEMVGAWWGSLPDRDDPDQIFGAGAVGYAVQHPSPEGMAMMCALKAISSAAMVREAAAAGVTELAGRGVAAPAWADQIARVSTGACWQLADVYGDQASLYCEFSYGDEAHALLALIDFNHLGGWIKDAWIADEPAKVLATMREQADAEPGTTVLQQLDPADARRLMEAGFAATDMTFEPDVPDTFRDFRAVALARCRALPESVATPADAEEVSPERRAALVAEFLASPQASGLTEAEETTAYCARLIVDHGADYDGGKVLRVSPVKTEIFLLDWLPRKVILDDADRAAIPAVFGAWTRWAAARNALPERAVQELLEVMQECVGQFAEDGDGENGSPARLFLAGAQLTDKHEIREVLARRTFAMPHLGTHIDGEELAPLDPGDPDERSILIEGEHPEWHALLRDPSFHGEAGGVNPRLHLAMHEIIANQLWDNDPVEVWQAGKRLLAAGVERHEALHRLGEVLMHHLHGVLTAGQPMDVDAYRRALRNLGR
jgi:hypothetical protein